MTFDQFIDLLHELGGYGTYLSGFGGALSGVAGFGTFLGIV
ncbi:hypothetical protein [Rhodococcus gannanensis]|jgi:hypothetical protein|uniref:Porin n=1 Tax=Rhodococcus gannanensis TaxID=1960308 RepID=A0ABW4PCI7_9NOCA